MYSVGLSLSDCLKDSSGNLVVASRLVRRGLTVCLRSLGFVNLSGISNHVTRRYASRSVSECLRGSIATPVVILSTRGYVESKIKVTYQRISFLSIWIKNIMNNFIWDITTNNFYNIMVYSRPGVTYNCMWNRSIQWFK